MKDWHYANLKERMYCNIEDNKKIAMPRYYKDKIYNEQQRAEIAHHQMQVILEKQMEADKRMTEETYRQRKEATEAAIRLFNKKILERDKQ